MLEDSTSALIVQTVGIEVSSAIQRAFRHEVERAGCDAGVLFIGYIVRVPDMAYVLWHSRGEMPVSMMIRMDDLADEQTARQVAERFATQWNQRIG